MTQRVVWLMVWMTLAFWLGNMGGCAHDQSRSMAGDVQEWVNVRAGRDWAPTPMTPPQVVSVEPPAVATPVAHVLDRAAWPRIEFRPADGRTRHWPVYWRDCPLPAATGAPASEMTDVPAALAQAVSGDRAANWDADNALHTLVQPVKAGVDVVLLPVKAVIVPPWQRQTTP